VGRGKRCEHLWDIPADKLNDDRLGRALAAFFQHRHAILASVASHVISTFRLPLEHLHYDTTHLFFYGAYEASEPIPDHLALPPTTLSAQFPPAHITHGYPAKDIKLVHAGLCSVVDDFGAVPLVGTLSAATTTAELHQPVLPSPGNYHPQLLANPILMISDRGTYSVRHVARLYHANHHALCSVPWGDFQALFEQHRSRCTGIAPVSVH